MNWVRRLGGIHPTVLVTWAFGFGAALLLPLVLALEGVPRIATAGGWAAVAVIGPVLTGLTFATAFAVMARAGARLAREVGGGTLTLTPYAHTQAMIFAWMPWVFMFMLGGFASGVLVYWIANNTITFTQQYLIMRSQGNQHDVFGNIKSSFKRKKPESK